MTAAWKRKWKGPKSRMSKMHFQPTKFSRRRARFNNTYCGHPGRTTNQWRKVTCKRCLRYRKFELGKIKVVFVETE